MCGLLAAGTGRAATLTWDANNTTSGAQDGSGDWFAANSWWNGTADVNWTDMNGATIGAPGGTGGPYTVTVSSPVIVTNLSFQGAASYVVTGTQITLTNTSGAALSVAAGQKVEIDSYIYPPNSLPAAPIYTLGANSILIIAGGGGNSTAGPAGGGFSGASYSTSTVIVQNNSFGVMGSFHPDNITLDVTNSGVLNCAARMDIARNGASVVNVGAGGQVNANTANNNDDTANLQVSRSQPGTLNVLDGGLASAYTSGGSSKGGNLSILPDSGSIAIMNVYSGATVNVGTGPNGTVGSSSQNLRSIRFMNTTASFGASATAVLNIMGGSVTAQNVVFGGSGTFTANPTNRLNLTGGTLYLGNSSSSSISQAANTGTNFSVNLSGGTLAAIANWSPACSVPINLTNINGNVTFQAADIGGNPFNMAFSGKLTGVGGFTKTGSGTLTLSGANNYSGLTTVKNGGLTLQLASLPTNGPVTLDGSSGNPTNSVQLSTAGQYWSIGTLTYASGSPVADFNFDGVTPSSTVAPIQVNGDVNFSVMPQIIIEGTAIPSGRYPLIKYTGNLSGSVPTALAAVPGYFGTARIDNNTQNKSIDLVMTSTFNAVLTWATGSGNWDFTTANWKQNGSLVDYTDGSVVAFDDSASTTLTSISVVLNQTVKPGGVLAYNGAKNYTISGSGSITGANSVSVSGTGTLTLQGKNSYSGGTVVNSGQLNINNSGDGSGNSAIGTGSLTLAFGSKIDNTSGASVTLLPNNQVIWNDDFTFVGTSNLDLGQGQLTLGSGNVTVTVVSNVLSVANPITDNNNTYGITKLGNGTLVLSNNNSFSGGVGFGSGKLYLGSSGAVGSGMFTIGVAGYNAGEVFDNIRGSSISLGSAPQTWNSTNFTFVGSANLDLGTGGIDLEGAQFQWLFVQSNTLSTEGAVTGHNRSLIKGGAGTLVLGGNLNDNYGLGVVVDAGVLQLAKTSTGSFHVIGTGGVGLVVNSNALAIITGSGGDQIADPAPVVLNGGVLDLNGQTETMNTMAITNGTLRNGMAASCRAQMYAVGPGTLAVGGDFANLDVVSGGTVSIEFNVTGTGTLRMTNAGTVNLLNSNNTFIGNVVVGAGKLALSQSATLTNASLITVSNGAVLDVTGLTNNAQVLTLAAGQTLNGNGSVNGSLVSAPGAVVAPGLSGSIGSLTVNNNVTLGGTLLLKLNRSSGQTSDQLLAPGGSITYGGSLAVTNIGSVLHVGDVFQLFPSAVTFAGVNLPLTDANGYTYTWENRVAIDGSIRVLTATPAINPMAGPIQYSISGSTLTLSWPTNLGWILLAQTNAPGVGLSSNWYPLTGSSAMTTTNITLAPDKGSMFFRLQKPASN